MNLKDAISFDPCGCQSKIVTAPNGQQGREVTPCPDHALQIAAESLARAAQMLGHIAEIRLRDRKQT